MSEIALPILLLGAIVAMIAGGLLFLWLVRLNRTPTGPETIVALLLALLVAESALYPNPSDVPAGIFHPTAGGLSFRVFDLLVPMALVARLFARKPITSIPSQALAWCAFLLWLAAAAITGILSGNSAGLVAFHAKAIIYIGTFALVAAVPAQRWLQSRALRNVMLMSSAVAAILLLTSQMKVAINIPNPLIPFVNFGGLGSDMASIFAVLGVGTFAVGLCSDRGRLRLLAMSLPMIAAPLASGQRAAMIGLGVSVAVCALLGAFALRNVRITLPEIGLSAFAAIGLVTAILLANTLSSDVQRPLPIVKEIQDTFTSRGKQLSEQDRVNQWAQARGLIADHPLLGSGLGKQYNYYSPASTSL